MDQLFQTGLFINDYKICDWNRDIIMAMVQKSDKMKELLLGERDRSRTLAQNLKQTNDAKKQSVKLLMEMMPRSVAVRFVNNPNADLRNICEV